MFAIFLIIPFLQVDAQTNTVDEGTWDHRSYPFICSDGNFIEAIQLRTSSSMVKWIDVKCTNTDTWFGGAGAYNEGSEQTVWNPQSTGFCGLSLAYDVKFRYMCFTNGGDISRCYGDSDYASDLQVAMSCTDNPPGNYRQRLYGIVVNSLEGGNDGFRGFKSYWNQTWECSEVLYIDHDDDSLSDLVGFYAHQGYFRGSSYWKFDDDSFDYCLFYRNQAWRIGSCSLGSDTAIIQIDVGEAYELCPEDFDSNQNWHWKDSSTSNRIPNLYMVTYDTVPLSWGNSVGFWAPVMNGNAGVFTYSETQSLTSSSTSSHEFTTTESTEFTSTFTSSFTEGRELGVSATFFDFGVSEQYNYASTLEESTSSSVVSATTQAISNSITNSATQEITCSISSGGNGVTASFQLWLWTVYRAAANYADTGAYKSTCDYALLQGTFCAARVPPNCPPGYCLDSACMTCIDQDGVEPLRAVALHYDDYSGCFNEIGIDVRCALSKRDYSCCTKALPCGEWEGDCDADWQCEGDLVCHQTGGIDYCLKADDPLVVGTTSRRKLSEEVDDEVTTSVYLPVHTGCAQFFDQAHCSAGPLYEYCTWDSDNDHCVVKDGMTDPDIDATWVYYPPGERNYCGEDCPNDDVDDPEIDTTLHYDTFSMTSEKIFKESPITFVLAIFGLIAFVFHIPYFLKKMFGQHTYATLCEPEV